jgi:uroporphyrinogen-III synthase
MSTSSPSGFEGLRVAIFEARMAGPLAEMVTRQGGVPLSAPAIREIPIDDNPQGRSFADTLLSGGLDVVIFETGVGVRYLVRSLQERLSPADWVAALSKTKVVARGPKPAAALREIGAAVDFQVPEPNTWHQTLSLIDAQIPVAGKKVAVQEYGQPVPELTEGLEARGAIVTRVPVYRWALPEDTGPLRLALQEIAKHKVGAALFTSAQQVEHVLQVAEEEGLDVALRLALASQVVVGSIGPTTSAALRAHGLPVDIEPEHPKSGHLVAAVAANWRSVGKG